MSRLFGTIRQIAFIVRDLDRDVEPGVYALLQRVAEVAQAWDGSDPVRKLRL